MGNILITRKDARAEMDSAPTPLIPKILQLFKRHTIVEYIKMVKRNIVPPFVKCKYYIHSRLCLQPNSCRLQSCILKIYFIHILQPGKFVLTINLYFPPPILNTTHLPTISAVPNVCFNSEKDEKSFFLHILLKTRISKDGNALAVKCNNLFAFSDYSYKLSSKTIIKA